jgi:hypothetical protein
MKGILPASSPVSTGIMALSCWGSLDAGRRRAKMPEEASAAEAVMPPSRWRRFIVELGGRSPFPMLVTGVIGAGILDL